MSWEEGAGGLRRAERPWGCSEVGAEPAQGSVVMVGFYSGPSSIREQEEAALRPTFSSLQDRLEAAG